MWLGGRTCWWVDEIRQSPADTAITQISPLFRSSFIHIFPAVGFGISKPSTVLPRNDPFHRDVDINDIYIYIHPWNDMNHPLSTVGSLSSKIAPHFFFRRHAPWAPPKTSVKTTRSFGTLWKLRCFGRGVSHGKWRYSWAPPLNPPYWGDEGVLGGK